MSITVSAPGKLMLLGEHAVVYGYPSLVTAVDQRLYVTIDKAQGMNDIIETPQVKNTSFVSETLSYFRNKYHKNDALSILTRCDFSPKLGFGSSSAVTVALLKALNLLYELNLTNDEIFHCGYEIVLKVQGTGSGFDIAAATFGKTVYYVRGGKTLEMINVPSLPLVVGYSGVKADTATLVRQVEKARDYNPEHIDSIFRAIEKLVISGRDALRNNDYKSFGSLMTENHSLLKRLNVSTPVLDNMVDGAVKAGAWGAKLSGAGGGDCMIALVSDTTRPAVEDAIRLTGGEIVTVTPNVSGVMIERT